MICLENSSKGEFLNCTSVPMNLNIRRQLNAAPRFTYASARWFQCSVSTNPTRDHLPSVTWAMLGFVFIFSIIILRGEVGKPWQHSGLTALYSMITAWGAYAVVQDKQFTWFLSPTPRAQSLVRCSLKWQLHSMSSCISFHPFVESICHQWALREAPSGALREPERNSC